jgi:diguanylate cyclase (GGDEF)-like protein/PAS domain S-box-containing protein
VQNRRTRLLIVAGWAIASIAWLVGPDYISSLGGVDNGISAYAELQYRIAEVSLFVLVMAVLGYLLLGSSQRDAADKRYYQPLIGASMLAAAYVEPTGTICYANSAFLRLFDVSLTAMGHISLLELMRGWTQTPQLNSVFPSVAQVQVNAHMDVAGGPSVDVLLTLRPARDHIEGFLVFATDVTAYNKLEREALMLDGVVQSLSQSLIVCDAYRPGLPIVFANAAAQSMTGYSMSELLGTPWSVLHGANRTQRGIAQLRAALEQNRPTSATIQCYRKDGVEFETETFLSLLIDKTGRLSHVVYLQRDVTIETLENGARNRELYLDSVTGLFNRIGYVRKLTTLLNQPADRLVLVAKIDINDFHEFNTAVGWEIGDALLSSIARQLSGALPMALVGRLESDHFAIGLAVEPYEVDGMVDTIREAVKGRYMLPGVTCDPVVSIGYTVARGGSLIRPVLQQASVALNEARASGGGETRRFDQESETRIMERRRLTAELQQAVQDRNFAVHYQPEVDLASGMIIGTEALVRWYHPLFGIQQASGFIALAEQTGMILDIGRLVLANAARFAAKLNRGRHICIPVAVNVSLGQLVRPHFVADLKQALEEAGALPAWIQLELTEMTYVSASCSTLAALSQLRAIGVGLAIDDFGTGYSSLSYLTQFPVSEIKIDRCFIRGARHSSVNRAVIKAILNIGSVKGARVIAEGIETQAEHEVLLNLGCTMGQGFFFSHPLPPEEFIDLVALGASLPVIKPTDWKHPAPQ